MTSITTPTFAAEQLRRAYADRDAAALLALYADDATVEIADVENTPSPRAQHRRPRGSPRARRRHPGP
jgi:ketosteroid isomerase-like protein